jgi:phosphonate transport system substrate-binding protein
MHAREIFRSRRFSPHRGLIATFLLCGLFLAPLFSSSSAHGGEVGGGFVLAVVPQLPPVTMHTNWTPFVQRLARDTGLPFSLKVYDSMDRFEDDLLLGLPDFVFSNPTQTVQARQEQGYLPLLRDSRPLSGYLFVRKDSPIKTTQDLQGKTVAFVGSKNL